MDNQVWLRGEVNDVDEMKNKVERDEHLVYVGAGKYYFQGKPVPDGGVEGWRALYLIGSDQLSVKPCSKKHRKKIAVDCYFSQLDFLYIYM